MAALEVEIDREGDRGDASMVTFILCKGENVEGCLFSYVGKLKRIVAVALKLSVEIRESLLVPSYMLIYKCCFHLVLEFQSIL